MCNNLIMPLPNLLKNITSKDKNISRNTIQKLIKSANFEDFKYLCENSDFIFSFLKERIINDFVKLVNKNDLDVVFKFAKIYNFDFEDLIVGSWLKYADEDLTDKILDVLENGNNDEKTYAAKYFSFVKDSLALEMLYKNSNSDFLPLRVNCAKTLKEFEDVKVLNEMKNKIVNSDDEFEKVLDYVFVLAFGGEENIKFCLEHCFSSPFLVDIISNLLDFNEFSDLKKFLNSDLIARIFGVLIENYPENISLNTIIYYQIFDFMEYLYNIKSSYAINLLAIAKLNFNEYLKNETYSFDLDNDAKKELKIIVEYLNSLNFDFDNIEQELITNNFDFKFEAALRVINDYKLFDYAKSLADIVNKSSLPLNFVALIVQVLKNLNALNLVDKQKIDNIEDKNLKAFIESCYV